MESWIYTMKCILSMMIQFNHTNEIIIINLF